MGGRPLTSRGISHVNEKDLKGPRLGICLGTIVIRKRYLMNNLTEVTMGRSLLLWLLGVPIPIILLIWLFGGLHG